MKIFSGTSNLLLAEKIAKNLGLKVSPLDIFVFPDGEKRVRVIDRVVDEHCIVVQPTNLPADNSYMELFFIVDALKRSGAEFVTAIVPYLGYQRQDHIFRDGEAVSLEVIAKTLDSTGLDRLICLDLHSVKIPQVFKISVEHLSALPLFAKRIAILCQQVNNCILISPDMGGIARIKKLSEMIGNFTYAAIEKDRDLTTGNVASKSFGEGRITNQKIAFVVDDMISSGKTISKAAELLKNNGVEKIYVFVTHAIFSDDASQILESAPVEKVFVTDSVYIPKKKHFSKLEILSVADIIAKDLYLRV